MIGRTLNEISLIIDLSWFYKRKKQYEIVNTTERFMYHIEQIKKHDLIAVDTETTGLMICSMPWGTQGKDTIVGICISYERNQGIYIPILHTQFPNMDMDLIVQYLFPLLETKAICTHNGIFDYKVFYDLGCKLNIVHDSMLLVFNIYSKVAKGTKALKNVTRMLYGDETIEFSDIFPDQSDYSKFKDISEEVCRIYACADSDYTLQIILDNYSFLEAKQALEYMSDCAKIAMISISEYYGKPIDVSKLPDCVTKTRENIRVLEDILFNYVGWKITGDMTERYVFKTSSNEQLSHLFFDVLKYKPIEGKNLKVDKFVLNKMKTDSTEDEDEYVKLNLPNGLKDLLKPDNQSEKQKLLSYSKIVHSRCVPAAIIEVLREQYKNLTSFFLKIVLNSNKKVGIFYSGISMTNTETARLVDFIQTLDGDLKYLIAVPDPDKRYMFGFDFAQIEYRVMAALANMVDLCSKLSNPHTDFHVECAALILRVLAEQITKATRKKFKPINFGIPYGIGVDRIVANIYGVGLSPTELENARKEVSNMLELWKSQMVEIMNMLNTYRRIATTPRDYNHILVKRSVKVTSYIQVPSGRYRVFDASDLSGPAKASMERKAGNTPIQAFARTIYLTAVAQLYDSLVDHGLADTKIENTNSLSGYSFKSKVTVNGYIHDEIFGFADNDVNPYFLYHLIYKDCMLQLKNHPRYYCGINICRNWLQAKNGEFEAPIDYVKSHLSTEPIVKFTDKWPEIVANDMIHWCNEDSIRYIESIAGTMLTNNRILDVDYIITKWKDYYYKDLLDRFGYPYRKKQILDLSENDTAINKLVGILTYYKYESVQVVYREKNIVETVRQPLYSHPDKFVKEEELTKSLLESIDIEECEDDDDFELMLSGEYDDFDKEKENPLDLDKNVGILLSVLS